ncbi:hypothetical protein RchiOBHm_Chr6g0264261 [Rosa chinensis]|uniref:Uncharacterized protein n=1 Tax=Rosa chinensis TaxID=74649 RepID=A0A2P6PP41_ROSCH|nr:hypothetical protein RchiOBHm_Chr6g0264261 [Rosa chinensis]
MVDKSIAAVGSWVYTLRLAAEVFFGWVVLGSLCMADLVRSTWVLRLLQVALVATVMLWMREPSLVGFTLGGLLGLGFG